MFHRGPDKIARGTVKLLLGQALFDTRESVFNLVCEIFEGRHGTGPFISLLTEAGDRLDGKPTPATVAQTKRTTIFSRAERAPSVNPRQPGAP